MDSESISQVVEGSQSEVAGSGVEYIVDEEIQVRLQAAGVVQGIGSILPMLAMGGGLGEASLEKLREKYGKGRKR